MSEDSDTTRETAVTTDQGTIREWADDHGAVPVRSERETGAVDLVPESAADDYERIDWSAFNSALKKSDLVVVYRESPDRDTLEVVEESDVDESEIQRRGPDYEEREIEGAEYEEHEPRDVGTPAAEANEERPDASDEPLDTDDEGMHSEEQPVRTTPTEADEGKPVVDASGDQVGMVADVDDQGVAYVSPHADVADRIMARLGWRDAHEGDYPLPSGRVNRITDDQVELEESATRHQEE